MRPLQAIIFDFDGVIADSERLHLRVYQDLLGARGLTLSDEDYFANYLGYDDVGLLQRYAREHALGWDEGAIRDFITVKTARYEALAAKGEMLFPGAARFIVHAAQAVPIAIASGALTTEIEDILDRASLRHHFVTIVGADQTARSKPSPDPYLEAFHRLVSAGHAIEPSRTVAIEDSRWGLVSAKTARLRCVGVATTYAAAELEPHSELVVSGLDTLSLDALDTLCSDAVF